MSFDKRKLPDARGIISYDKYQVVIANGDETVLEIAKRLGIGRASVYRALND